MMVRASSVLSLPMDKPLKYLGAKTWLLPRLRDLYDPHRHRRLREPCVGGMTVALGLRPRRALLTDVNFPLIHFYARLRDPRPFTIDMVNTEEAYYAARERFNALIVDPVGRYSTEAAELVAYLNKTCFNGVTRFNQGGLFNVPYGKYKKLNYRRDFSEYAPVLSAWELGCDDLNNWTDDPEDWIFFDPPYDDGFTTYSKDGFDWPAQVKAATRYAAHPGPVVATNKATDRVMELYRGLGYKVEQLAAPRSVSAKGDRIPAVEMLATKNLEAT